MRPIFILLLFIFVSCKKENNNTLQVDERAQYINDSLKNLKYLISREFSFDDINSNFIRTHNADSVLTSFYAYKKQNDTIELLSYKNRILQLKRNLVDKGNYFFESRYTENHDYPDDDVRSIYFFGNKKVIIENLSTEENIMKKLRFHRMFLIKDDTILKLENGSDLHFIPYVDKDFKSYESAESFLSKLYTPSDKNYVRLDTLTKGHEDYEHTFQYQRDVIETKN